MRDCEKHFQRAPPDGQPPQDEPHPDSGPLRERDAGEDTCLQHAGENPAEGVGRSAGTPPQAGGAQRPAGGRARAPQEQPRVPDRPPGRPRTRERAAEGRHRPPLRRMCRAGAGHGYGHGTDRRGAAPLLPRLAPRERQPPARRALQPRSDGARTEPKIIYFSQTPPQKQGDTHHGNERTDTDHRTQLLRHHLPELLDAERHHPDHQPALGRHPPRARRPHARSRPARSAAHAPRRDPAEPPRGRRPRGRTLAAALALERREGRTGLPAGRPAGDRQPLEVLRPPVGHELRNPPHGLQQGDGPTPHCRLHGTGEQGAEGMTLKNNTATDL